MFHKIPTERLQEFDQREAPHGIYGVRAAYAQDQRLPSLAYVLASARANVLNQLYRNCYSRRASNEVSLEVANNSVLLTVLDHALTKVRCFGDKYRLDTYNTKASWDTRWRLDKLIPKLSKGIRAWNSRIQALLLALHAPTLLEMARFVGNVSDPVFLNRYSTSLASDIWEDRHGRHFHTGLYLWVNTTLMRTP